VFILFGVLGVASTVLNQ